MTNKRLLFFISFISLFLLFLSFSSPVFAADPKLISQISKGFEKIQDWIIKIATPAAAVAVRYWCFYEKI